jgi:sugar phosphate isomerase/epimerase
MKQASVSRTRREWLFGMAGAALAYSQPRNRMYNPLLAVHTSLWQAEAALRNTSLAVIQEEAFTTIQRAGYRRVELISDFLAPDVRTRTLDLLRRRDLQPALVSVSGPLWEKAAAEDTRDRVLEVARLMNGWDTRFIDFHPAAKPGGAPKTTAELDTQAYQLSRMGQDLAHSGMGLLAGHGLAEMQDDAREWRYTVGHTETALVSFCVDLECAVRGGVRPLTLLDSAGVRLRSLQLRNLRNGANQELLREGDIDMVPIARFLRQSLYDGFLVVDLRRDAATPREHSATQALSLSRWYMQEIFGTRQGSPPVDMGPHVRERKQG